MTRKTRIVMLALAAAIAATGLIALAGDLNPPPGAVAPTYKTLTEVEPRIAINSTNTPGDADSLFQITQPGSYYLTGNITGVIGKHGIEIAAGGSGVTLDLNGFDLVGVPAMGGFDGVRVTVNNLTNIAVVNGSVRNWGGEGVDLGTLGAVNCRVQGVLVSGSVGSGIFTGNGSTVANCSAYNNTVHGIVAINGCTVTNCSASQNTGHGISAGSGCTVADCSARQNTLDGIRCISQCIIRGNTCSINGSGVGDGAGIHATSTDNRIEGNNCTGADRGIDIDGDRNRIDNNSVNSNTVGFDIDGVDNLVIRNTASGNAPNYSIVAGNSVAPRISVTDSDGWAGITNANHPFANFGY